jgi:GAF domain-containing protein
MNSSRAERWRAFFARPRFADEEKDRQASVLFAALTPIFLVTLVLIPGLPLLGAPPETEIFVFIMLGVEAWVLTWLRQGKVRQASLVLCAVGWVVTTLPAFLQGGVTSPFALFGILWVVVSGMLLDVRWMTAMLVVNLAVLGALTAVSQFKLLPVVIPQANAVRLLNIMAIVMYVAYTMIRLSTSSMRRALTEAQRTRGELLATNQELSAARQEMEARVAERTAELERRALELQASVEVVRAIASIHDLKSLLNEICRMLSGQFDFYHVAVFLLDENQQQLVMNAANTEGGKKLIESGFSVGMERISMVTTALRTRKPYLAADVSKEVMYLAQDEFAATRSELALPLISGAQQVAGERVLGVLDMQSDKMAAFSAQDLGILQTLANQVAIAIENAQLFTRNAQALQSLQRAYSSLSREGWGQVLQTQRHLGFKASAAQQVAAQQVATQQVAAQQGAAQQGAREQEMQPGMAQALASGQVVKVDASTLATPIKIREQVVGVIQLRKAPQDGEWTQDEIDLVETLCDRLSTALEAARLYEETRRRAERERLTGEITARMRSSNDPKAILEIAARELRKALHADKAQLIIQTGPAGAEGRAATDGQASDNGAPAGAAAKE